jgi:sensor domain CHASE-containing protein
MSVELERIILVIVLAALAALFGFQLWAVLRSGHVRWRSRKFHKDHRPTAFALELAADALGLVLCLGALLWVLVRWITG